MIKITKDTSVTQGPHTYQVRVLCTEEPGALRLRAYIKTGDAPELTFPRQRCFDDSLALWAQLGTEEPTTFKGLAYEAILKAFPVAKHGRKSKGTIILTPYQWNTCPEHLRRGCPNAK